VGHLDHRRVHPLDVLSCEGGFLSDAILQTGWYRPNALVFVLGVLALFAWFLIH